MKKSTKIVLSLVASTMLFTGCGGGGDSATDSSDNNLNSGSQKQSYTNGSTTTAKHAKAQLGVLADATVKIYGLGNKTKKLLFTETTTSGSTIEQIGNFNAHENELLNDVYYLYEVEGGDDWDADDDGVVNQSAMENRGTFRAIIKGSTIKSLGGNITISAVSEMLYTKVSDSIRTPDILDEKIEKASKEIIKDDLNSDGKVDSSDIVYYNPIHDKDKLHNTYKEKIENIIDDIHGDKKIDIPTEPDEKIKKIDRKAPKIILDKNIVLTETNKKGKIEFKIESESSFDLQVELLGEDKEMFELQGYRSSYTLWSKEYIDFEKPFDSDKDNVFNLIIKAKDSYGNTTSLPVTVTIKDIADILPILKETYVEFPKRENIEDNLTDGDILIGKMEVYNKGDRDISSFKIIDGYRFYNFNYYFRIDKQGNLYLKSDKSYLDKLNEENNEKDDAIRLRKEILSHFNEEGYLFNIPITATTKAGTSKEVDFRIVITTDKDYPVKPHVISHVGGAGMPYMKSLAGNASIGGALGIAVAPNGRVFVERTDSFLSINVDNKKDPFIENKYTSGGFSYRRKIAFSQDMSKVFSYYRTGPIRMQNSIKIRDFSDTKDVKYLGRIVLEQGQHIKDFELSDNENTLFVLESENTKTDNKQHISIYDVSDPSSPKLISRIEADNGIKPGTLNNYDSKKILLSSDGSKLYAYGSSYLDFYDVHDIKHPRFIKSIKFHDHSINFLSDSKDGSKLYLAERAYGNRKEALTKLAVYDVHDINNPQYLNNFYFKDRPFTDHSFGINQMIASPDGEKLYIGLYTYGLSPSDIKYKFYIIDMKEPTSPEIIGTISGIRNIRNVAISNDGTTIYTDAYHKLTGLDTTGLYTIDVREDSEKED